jgi:hypothetical protein
VAEATPLAAALRALTGGRVTLATTTAVVHGTLLSCTRQSVWMVADDADVVVPIAQIRAVDPD